jgi:hypothetical protein
MQRNGAAPVLIFFFCFCFRVSFFYLTFQGSVLAVANNYSLASANAAIHTYLADLRSASRDSICGEEGGTGQLGEEAYGAAQQKCPDSMGVIGKEQNVPIRLHLGNRSCRGVIGPVEQNRIQRVAEEEGAPPIARAIMR